MNTLSQIMGWIALGWAVVAAIIAFAWFVEEMFKIALTPATSLMVVGLGTCAVISATCAMWLLR